MVYGYTRVSSKQQSQNYSIEYQSDTIKKQYADAIIIKEVQSAKNVDERPELLKMCSQLEKGDVLVCTRLDRLARSVSDGIGLIDDLLGKGVSIHILDMGYIDNTPVGRLILHVIVACAEFQRSIIRENCRMGYEIAKTKDGFTEGRPPKFTNAQIAHAVHLKDVEGLSYTEVGRRMQMSKSTLIRAMKKHRAEH